MIPDAESIEEPQAWTEEDKTLLIQKGLVLTQLLEYPKFVQFLNVNFDFVKDEETHTMHVMEVSTEDALKRVATALRDQRVAASSKLIPATEVDLKRLKKHQK